MSALIVRVICVLSGVARNDAGGQSCPGGRFFRQHLRRLALSQLLPLLAASRSPMILDPAVGPPADSTRRLPPTISSCGADHLPGDNRLRCNPLQITVDSAPRAPLLPNRGPVPELSRLITACASADRPSHRQLHVYLRCPCYLCLTQRCAKRRRRGGSPWQVSLG
jgi:hypothetical protein